MNNVKKNLGPEGSVKETDKRDHKKSFAVKQKEEEGQQKQDPLETTSLAGVFAVTVLLLALSTMWALWDETYTRRPWKSFQSDFLKIAEQKLEKELAAARAVLERSEEYQNHSAKLLQARKALNASAERKRFVNRIAGIDKQLEEFRKSFMIARGQYQAAVYQMERTSDDEERKTLLAKVQAIEESINQTSSEMTRLDASKLDQRKALTEIGTEMEALTNRSVKFEKPLREVKLKLEDILTEKIYIRQRFNKEFSLVDRCESCHLAATKKGFSDLPHPFRTHSDVVALDLPDDAEITGTRTLLDIHPVNKYGCTSCHRGQGYATSTVNKGHGEVEFWSTPLLRGGNVQAACLKCHARQPRINGADLLSKGRMLFSDLGCVWCHNTGVISEEERRGDNVFDLSQVPLKLNINWTVGWIENPKRFRPQTAMPNFFLKSSQAAAIAAYLWKNSRSDMKLTEFPPFDEEQVAPGKILFESRACLACHKAGDQGNTHAANLSRIGEKTSYVYLANWISNPRKWQPDGEMPLVVFKPDEAAKIAAYLSTLSTDYAYGVRPDRDSPQLAEEGKRLILKYECYRCHNIIGLGSEEASVPELEKIGSKPVGHLDFGMLEDEILQAGGLENNSENESKARELWIRHKLKDPRGFDKGKYLKPGEGLRMPDFDLKPEQIDALIVFLLGITDEKPPLSYQYIPTSLEEAVGRGGIYFRHYRCFACHGEEGVGGILNPNYTKDTVPDLNTLADKLHLEELEDTITVMEMLVQGFELGDITRSSVPRFAVVKGQYQAMLKLVFEGQIVKKKELSGPEPPFHMPSWKDTLTSRQLNDIIIYLLFQYSWDEEEWEEDDWDEDEG